MTHAHSNFIKIISHFYKFCGTILLHNNQIMVVIYIHTDEQYNAEYMMHVVCVHACMHNVLCIYTYGNYIATIIIRPILCFSLSHCI